MTDGPLPIGDVLPGIEIEDLPEGDTPMEIVSLVKTLDEDGDVAWYVRCSNGVSDVEIMGALLMELDRRRFFKASTFDPTDSDDA